MGRWGGEQATWKGGDAARGATWSRHTCLWSWGCAQGPLPSALPLPTLPVVPCGPLMGPTLSCLAARYLNPCLSGCALCGKHSPSPLSQGPLWDALCDLLPSQCLLWPPPLTQGTCRLVWPQAIAFKGTFDWDLSPLQYQFSSPVLGPHIPKAFPPPWPSDSWPQAAGVSPWAVE